MTPQDLEIGQSLHMRINSMQRHIRIMEIPFERRDDPLAISILTTELVAECLPPDFSEQYLSNAKQRLADMQKALTEL